MRDITEEDLKKYGKKYNKNIAYRFLKKLREKTRLKPALLAKPVGSVVECLGHFMSALDNPETPVGVKARIICAVAYIITPVDLIPDAIPIVGFADDAGAAKLVIDSVRAYSTFSLQKLDDEIDGISRVYTDKEEDVFTQNESTDDTQASEEINNSDIQRTVESIQEQAEQEPVTTETYDSTMHSFDDLKESLKKGNELFQQFLDKNYELDDEFNKNQEKNDSLSSDMWDAINKI